MKTAITIITMAILLSCSKQDSKTCTCKNWTKAGKVESTHPNSSKSDCNYRQAQYNNVWPGEVICDLN